MVAEYTLKSGATLRYRKFEPKDQIGCIQVLCRTLGPSVMVEDVAQRSFATERRVAEREGRKLDGRFNYAVVRSGVENLWGRYSAPYRAANFLSTAKEFDYYVGESAGQIVGVIGAERCPPSAVRIEEALHGVPAEQKAAVKASLKGPPQANIHDLAVAYDLQCIGIGRIMLAATILRLAGEGITSFDAFVPSAALPVFRLAGFREAGRTVESMRWGQTWPMRTTTDSSAKSILQSVIGSATPWHKKPDSILLPA